MTVKNPIGIWSLRKVLRLKTYKVEFEFLREQYDEEVTKLSFLNNAKSDFNEKVDDFNEQLDREIENASSSRSV